VNHGLNLGGSPHTWYIPITWDIVTQAFDILARRVKKINRVMRLEEEAAFKVFSLTPLPHQISELPLPEKMKTMLKNISPLLTDIIDRDLWRTHPQTVLTISGFPRFLLRHVDQSLQVRSAHYMRGMHDLNWFMPNAFLTQ
jgi:hypothetical protein